VTKALLRRFLLLVFFSLLYLVGRLVLDWALPGYLSGSEKELPFFLCGVLIADYARMHIGTSRLRSGVCPPLNAEFLFYLFLDAKNCDALVGDLEERYRVIRRKFGSRRANFWYWTQAIRSVGPVAWAWVKNVVMKPIIGVIGWAVAKGLLAHDSWLAALAEVWRRIRS